MKSAVLHGHSHPEATSLLQGAHHNHGKCVLRCADFFQMSDRCRSAENWIVAFRTSRFLPVPDGRLWKPRADHSQSPCRLETAACRLREERRQKEDHPHAKKKKGRKRQKERKEKVSHPCKRHITAPSHIYRQCKQDNTNTAELSILASIVGG